MTELLTTEDLRKILDKNVLKGPKRRQTWNMPSPEAIEKLTNTLNWWRDWFAAAQKQRAFNAKLEAAEKAVLRLREIMPEIYEYRKRAADAGDPFSIPLAKSAEKLMIALGYPGDPDCALTILGCFQKEDLPDQFKDWKWLNGNDEVLLKDFEAAMTSTNPNFEAGLNSNGPFPRYAAAVLKFVTGEEPAATSIATRMKETRRTKKS